jgi:hypothetical protein
MSKQEQDQKVAMAEQELPLQPDTEEKNIEDEVPIVETTQIDTSSDESISSDTERVITTV